MLKHFFLHLLEQQLLLYGRLARALDNDVLRKMSVVPGTLQLVTERFIHGSFENLGTQGMNGLRN